MSVPTATSLEEIYHEDVVSAQRNRWDCLIQKFKRVYGKRPDFVARSPGRVNIIGEHIDYSMYDVLPMAISTDVIIAVGVAEDSRKFRLANVLDRFPTREFSVNESGHAEIDASSLEWSNYFKAGLKGVNDFLNNTGRGSIRGMDVLVDGTVPAGSGLSSSAALVCASALSAMKASGCDDIDKLELCDLAIASERSVGVNSGGMDQAASVLSLRDHLTYVSFVPKLKAQAVQVPAADPAIIFMAAQSFVAADKYSSSKTGYNLRVVECTLAARVLANIFRVDLKEDKSPLGYSLRGFHDAYHEKIESITNNNDTTATDLEKQLARLVKLVEDYLPQEEGYTREQLSHLLDSSVEEIEARFMTKFPVEADAFKLRQRALHVFSEAERVLKFFALVSEPPHGEESLAQRLGGLMNDTQASCRDVYQCSCAELDELCELARNAGSLGSRLTGAGWGGCSVHLVPADKVEAVKKSWIDGYYKKKWPDITDDKLSDAIIVSKPGSGSYLLKVTEQSFK